MLFSKKQLIGLSILLASCTSIQKKEVLPASGFRFPEASVLLVDTFHGTTEEETAILSQYLKDLFSNCPQLQVFGSWEVRENIQKEGVMLPLSFSPAPHELADIGKATGARYLLSSRLDFAAQPDYLVYQVVHRPDKPDALKEYDQKQKAKCIFVLYDLKTKKEVLTFEATIRGNSMPYVQKNGDVWLFFKKKNFRIRSLKKAARHLKRKCACD